MTEKSTRGVICKGCDQMKTVPMILLEEHTYTEGLCPECVKNYGMQVGDKVRLRRPDEYGETEVMFVGPEVNAMIRVRSYRGGLTKTVSCSEFERA